MSGSFESVRPDLGLYSCPKEYLGMESKPPLTQREKFALPEAQSNI